MDVSVCTSAACVPNFVGNSVARAVSIFRRCVPCRKERLWKT